jgi:hypothetical protein
MKWLAIHRDKALAWTWEAIKAIVFSALGGLLVIYFTMKKPELSSDFNIFKLQQTNIGTTQYNAVVTIKNTGSKEASKVLCGLNFPNVIKIQSCGVKPSSELIEYEWMNQESITKRIISIKELYDGERIDISCLVESPINLDSVDVQLRGEGVQQQYIKYGIKEKEPITIEKFLATFFAAILVIVVISTVVLIVVAHIAPAVHIFREFIKKND